MGRFQEVTTSTIDLGNSTFIGLATVISLRMRKYITVGVNNAVI